MDEETAKAASPINWMPDTTQQFEAWVGSEESDEYHRQSRELANPLEACLALQQIVCWDEDTNHFNIISALTQ